MATSDHNNQNNTKVQDKQQSEVTDEDFQHELLQKLDELRKTNFLCDTTI